MRLERRSRSLSIFSGSLLALILVPVHPELQHLLRGLVALLAAFAVATLNYIVNVITDAPYDRHHPDKQHRPLVAHRLSAKALVAGAVGVAVKDQAQNGEPGLGNGVTPRPAGDF